MSSKDASGTTEANSNRKRAIRAAYREKGAPPTVREVEEQLTKCCDWREMWNGKSWNDVLRSAGVPGTDDLLAEALRERFDDRYPWQESIVLKAKWMTEETDLRSQQVGVLLKDFADGECDPDALDGLAVSRVGTGSGHTKWRVEGR